MNHFNHHLDVAREGIDKYRRAMYRTSPIASEVPDTVYDRGEVNVAEDINGMIETGLPRLVA